MRENEPVLLVLSVCDREIILEKGEMLSEKCQISPQMPHYSRALAEKLELTFALLSDRDNHVARQFGLVFTIDKAVRGAYKKVCADLPRFNGTDSWELPMAGTFLVDPSGIVRLAFVNPDFTRRLDPSVIIARLNELEDESERPTA